MNATGEGLNKKPEGLLTNSPEIAEEVDKRCECKENHVPLMGGAAIQSGVFVKESQKATLRGLKRQLVSDGVFFEDLAVEVVELEAFYEGYGNDLHHSHSDEDYDDFFEVYLAEMETIVEEDEAGVDAEEDVSRRRRRIVLEPTEDIEEEDPGREGRASLLRVHKNVGHTKFQEFLQALRVGGCRDGIRR